MEKEQRSRLQKATQDARRLLEEEFSRQLLETYDINVAAGRWSEEPGAHLQAEQRLLREKLLAWIEHRSAQINDKKEALLLTLREMAFTALNRFVALKLMEARELVRPCVSGGLESEGFQEFTAVAQGLLVEQESSYRLYLETIFEDVSRELRALFDPRDPASLLWPKRTALLELLEILNRPELAELWREDETLGWIYQYFNGDAERKKMREESSAPRNSRELAVRNQFFTPRYVVEFLTDNTLGRIWYEMRHGDTGLKERCRYLVRRPNEIWLQPGEDAPAEVVADDSLSQEELLRQPVHIPYRPLKDPREIRMLDPACGSMHFGLYAFDLYLAIYEEAWEIAQGSDEQAKQEEAFAAFVTYAAGIADKAAFLREVPRLILLHNIHGVDIDPRATQIARLTLWLRAQRAWQEQKVEVAARPAISRSNVVCAEPMPGEKELLADFVDQQFPEAERGLVQQLLEVIFDKMQLAGEAGSLLKIEEEIRDAIEQARREWQKLAIQQRDLFSAAELAELGGVGSSMNTDLQNLTKGFWVNIEERIYNALRDYANQAESGGYQRRLFAEDAAQGFAFIDTCRKRYDSILMNPPFGLGSKSIEKYAQACYQGSAAEELAASFYSRALELLSRQGRVGEISSRTIFFLPTLADWRKRFLFADSTLHLYADLGEQILDGAFNETSAYVSTKSKASCAFASFGMFHRSNDISADLLSLSRSEVRGEIYQKPLSAFKLLADHPLCYWISSEFTRSLQKLEPFGEVAAEVQMGLAPRDEFRFSRLWWEVLPQEIGESKSWACYAKGGELSPYYSDVELVLRSEANLAEIKAALNHKYPYLKGNLSWVLHPENNYFEPGLTFGQRTAFLRLSILPKNCYFSVAGKAVFGKRYSSLFLLQAINTPAVQFLTYLRRESLSMNPQFQEGDVARIPWPSISKATIERIEQLSVASASAVRMVASFDEIDHAFYCCSQSGEALSARDHAARILAENEEEASKAMASEIGLSKEDSEFIEREILPRWKDRSTANWFVEREEISFLSYLVGLLFGRWDVRSLQADKRPGLICDPFESLPVCPVGQLQNAKGLPGSPLEVSESYPLSVCWGGILVLDNGHTLDVLNQVNLLIELLNKSRAGHRKTIDAQELCCKLNVNNLREYFGRTSNFFADHLKHYSKSRRQAPIYWQLSAGNGNYSAWLYYHRFTQDTLYRVLGDFVDPRIQEAEREQFEFESQGGLSGDAASLLHEVQALLQDLRLFKSELELVAPLWNPNLNDGVIINHAILWRVTPYTPWQKKCKECWDKLVKGDYDWAHLAFHLWPERVIRKCTIDRSLAIAHGLEERLWQETSKGNWLQRQLPEAELQALIAEHSKPAVQNALERFLAAPPPVAAARTRAPRVAKSASAGVTRRPRGSATEVDAEASRQTLLVLTAAPSEGLGRNAIAELLAVEAASLTAVIKQLKEGGQIEQLGAARGARYRLSESGLAAIENQAGEVD
jgi:hypothetical protein